MWPSRLPFGPLRKEETRREAAFLDRGAHFMGAVRGKFMTSEGRGSGDGIAMGVTRALGGALLFGAAEILVQGKMIYTMLAAIAGAAILTLLARYRDGRLEYGSTD